MRAPPFNSMRAALGDKRYFGKAMRGETWNLWRILLIAIMGEPLEPAELIEFERLTNRAASPTEPVKESWQNPDYGHLKRLSGGLY